MINLKVLVILFLLSIFFGNKKIPEFIDGVSQASGEFKKSLKPREKSKSKTKNG